MPRRTRILAAVFLIVSATFMSAQKPDAPGHEWWKRAVFYELYPRSFADSNNDGVGDLNGITSKMGYLRDLGVDAIWISPCFPSPQVDFGYDVSDYENIDPMYGTLKDFDAMAAEGKKNGVRIILDFVVNHSSDKHPWFTESASSKSNPKRDWYIWRDGKGPGEPPNNWQSTFGHSAWKWDPKTSQWYYHRFYAEQPDLNWRNPAVERAMFGVYRFWLNKGVAGFRLDAVPTLFEDEQLRDEKVVPGTNAYGDPNLDDSMTNNLPELHQVMRELRKVTNSYPGNRVLIGETYLPDISELRKWYGANHDELQLPMDMQVGFLNKLDVGTFRTRIDQAEHDMDDDQPLFVFDNHDNVRSWNRYGDGKHNTDIARIIATLLLGTRATAMMYYGEELGMTTTMPTRVEDVRDPIGKIGWPNEKGRDGERTPMQWDGSPNAGFAPVSATPWLPVPSSYKTVNVAIESREDDSLLSWYQQLIKLRRDNPALHVGALTMLNVNDKNVLSWLRKTTDGQTVLIACNFTAQPQNAAFDLSPQGVSGKEIKALLQTPGMDESQSLSSVKLLPYGVYIGQVQ